jgi:hypothetical protein
MEKPYLKELRPPANRFRMTLEEDLPAPANVSGDYNPYNHLDCSFLKEPEPESTS